ncbi:hypothetical protein WNY78_09150 [Psychroserpens sp. AS72]|uniref:hypothetical protein n=1 Tax=Psychroserpens sp. AS72 TaxID=3135775 RepID=UPI00317CA03B
MNIDILSILGQPLKSTLVQDILKKSGIELRKKTIFYDDGDSFETEGFYSKLYDIIIDFEHNAEGDKIVNEITIDPTGGPLTLGLPFGLQLKDSSDTIIIKLDKKPKSKEKSIMISKDPEDYQYAWWFEKDHQRILTALNGHHELLWMRIKAFSQQELQILELKKNLKLQKDNINLEVDFSEILKESPCLRWTQSLKENEIFRNTKSDEYVEDFWFNNNIIKDSEVLITDYLEKLTIACSKRSGIQIYNAVKWFVKKLNTLNNRNNGFIETLERDELGVFIDKTIERTGLKIDDTDITEEWREW